MKSVYNSKYSNKNSLLTLGSMGEPLAKEIAFWFSNFFLRKNKLLLMHIIKPKMEPSFLHQNFLMILKKHLTEVLVD